MDLVFGRGEKLLLSMNISDGIVYGWFGVWYVKMFLPLVDSECLGVNTVVGSLVGLCAMWLIAAKVPRPGAKLMLAAWIAAYCALLALLLSPCTFLMSSTIMGGFCFALFSAFKNKINELNVPNCRRAKYDNYTQVFGRVGNMIGGILAYISICEGVSHQIVWVVAYMAFDLELVLMVYLIRNRVIEY